LQQQQSTQSLPEHFLQMQSAFKHLAHWQQPLHPIFLHFLHGQQPAQSEEEYWMQWQQPQHIVREHFLHAESAAARKAEQVTQDIVENVLLIYHILKYRYQFFLHN
jgi:hypothetical protein